MPDNDLTSALKLSLELEDESPLGEVQTDSVDELLARMSENLAEGLPHKITDADLRRAVMTFRAQSLRWKQEEDEKSSKPKRERAAPGTKAKKINFAEALDVEL